VVLSGDIRTSTGRLKMGRSATLVSVARSMTDTVSSSPLHTTAVPPSGLTASPRGRSPVSTYARTDPEAMLMIETLREVLLPATRVVPSGDMASDRVASPSGGSPLRARPSKNPAGPLMSYR
jgi:hypothetical protein